MSGRGRGDLWSPGVEPNAARGHLSVSARELMRNSVKHCGPVQRSESASGTRTLAEAGVGIDSVLELQFTCLNKAPLLLALHARPEPYIPGSA